jgi:hypothetical protein
MCETMPGFSLLPWIVKVLPEPVDPYAKIVVFSPFSRPGKSGLNDRLYTSCWDAVFSMIPWNPNWVCLRCTSVWCDYSIRWFSSIGFTHSRSFRLISDCVNGFSRTFTRIVVDEVRPPGGCFADGGCEIGDWERLWEFGFLYIFFWFGKLCRKK